MTLPIVCELTPTPSRLAGPDCFPASLNEPH